MALHEIPEERYAAMELNSFKIVAGRLVTITYEKLKIEAISTETIPCSEDGKYSAAYCTIEKV